MSIDRYLVVFAKEPLMGRVKTRLARGLGPVQATAFYRRQTADLIRRMSQDPRWTTVVAITPDRLATSNGVWPQILPQGVARIAQGPGDLGQRMSRVFQSLPPGPALIVGSDIPSIRPAHIAKAFNALGSSDVVIGPSHDGGYWLVGQRRRPRVLPMFQDVRWSSAHTLADTLQSLPCYTKVAQIETLNDVDTEKDYLRYIDGS